MLIFIASNELATAKSDPGDSSEKVKMLSVESSQKHLESCRVLSQRKLKRLES